MPVRAREIRSFWSSPAPPCVPPCVLITECTTSRPSSGGAGLSRLVHATLSAISAPSSQSPLISMCSPCHREANRRKDWQLWKRDARRWQGRIIEYVTENVVCIVEVHHAQIRRYGDTAGPRVPRDTHVQPLGEGQPFAVPRPSQKLKLRQRR